MSQRRAQALFISNATREMYDRGTVPVGQSVWTLDHPRPEYPALDSGLEADVVVVGAGLTGAALCLQLAERGLKTVLLEAAQPADAASGRNAGHVQPYLLTLDALVGLPGGGKAFLDLLIEHKSIVYEWCRRYGIEADQVQAGLMEVARKDSAALRKTAALWKGLGLEVDELGAAELKGLLGSERYQFGVIYREGGCVNPWLFTNGMVKAAEKLGARVFGDSPVIACEAEQGRRRVRTARGSVLAERVVLCTNGHVDEKFYPQLGRSNYPLLACGLATKPLPVEFARQINPTRAAISQYPAGLFPTVIDGRGRLVSATVPGLGKAHRPELYFDYLLRHLHRTYPQSRELNIELETFWTGMTHNSSSNYEAAYPKFYRVDEGVFGLMNFGSWGNFLAPVMAVDVARALAADAPESCVLGCEQPQPVSRPDAFSIKLRRYLIPLARLGDRFNRV